MIEDLKEIFRSGVAAVDPYSLVKSRIHAENDSLIFCPETGITQKIDLNDYKRILLLGAGKASAKMARGIEELLDQRIETGFIAVKDGYTEKLKHTRVVEAGHPIPDERSLLAAKEVVRLAKDANEQTLVIFLVSGGGSALLSYPLEWKDDKGDHSLTLEEKQKTTQSLLSCGATVQEVNCVRKRVSAIKGGGLASLLYPATVVNLIISDVVGDRLDVIASGITVWDDDCYEDALNIIEKYGLNESLPRKVMEALKAERNERTPAKPGKRDPIYNRVYNFILGSNLTALKGAEEKAQELGYHTVLLSSQVTGEAREVAKLYLALAQSVRRRKTPGRKPICLLGGGETTVTVSGQGVGGRNQEMALSFLTELESLGPKANGISFLSASTDGTDATDAAGASASLDELNRAKELGLNPMTYLISNDAYTFFDKVGALLRTGPTGTNVCDLQVTTVS